MQAPGASMILPPDISSSDARVCAITSGLRSRTIWVVPSVSFEVASENVASAVGESRFSSIVSEKNPIS